MDRNCYLDGSQVVGPEREATNLLRHQATVLTNHGMAFLGVLTGARFFVAEIIKLLIQIKFFCSCI